MARLNVDGDKSIYFEDLGSGDKALILIHGWGMSGRGVGWRSDSAVGFAGLRVITIDHRGCGRSDHDFADLSIDAIAGDVVVSCRFTGAQNGLPQWLVFGWCCGHPSGAFVWERAVRR